MANESRTDEAWVSTTCNGCFPQCAIRVHRKDGKIVGSKGDPAVYSSLGKCCGKSMSRVADLYHPDRVTKPLKRTNPEKGIGVDPKWVEISWEEAMDTIVRELARVREEDPRKLVIAGMDLPSAYFQYAFGKAFGTVNDNWYGASWCGGGLHTNFFTTLGAINSEPDLPRANLAVQWGSQFGLGANNNPGVGVRDMAEFRKRGGRLIVIDPLCSHAAAKADEWVPIIPGSDGALGLGICNVLVNELDIFDAAFLKVRTNGPYLIGDDGHYVRHEQSLKPLVWDTAEKTAKVFDDPTAKDFALEGSYEVDGKKCRPAFELLREHLKEYDPEKVSKITSVPVTTIRRLAKQIGEAAQVGKTIQIGGRTLPHRPVSIETKRGGTQHKNGYWNVYSIILANILLGAMDVPGGLLGTHANGPFGMWALQKSKDGLVATNLVEGLADMADFLTPYPPREVKPPVHLDLRELFPVSGFLNSIRLFPMHDPEKFRMPYAVEALILFRFNPLVTMMDNRPIVEVLKKLKLMVAIAWRIDETVEFADIVLPEPHDFERFWPFPANQPAGYIKAGPGPWYGQPVQPVVDPPRGVKNWTDVLVDLAERLGILAEMNHWINMKSGLVASDELKLEPDKKYYAEDLARRTASLLNGGEEYQDEWFRDKGAIDFYEKTLPEAYPGCFTKARIPIYFEHLIGLGEDLRRVTKELGMEWWDTTPYHPLPEWYPCRSHAMGDQEYDLFIANAKLPLVSQTITSDNPWVNDICTRNPLDYNILLHPTAAAKRGIKDGDTIWVESDVNKVKGRVRVTECVHPQVVGTFSTMGHWAKGKRFSRGKGVHINSLIRFGWDMVDPLSGQIDYCAKVKVYKA